MRKRGVTTMGIDLGDRFSYVHVLSPTTGEVLEERRVRTRMEDLDALFASRRPLRIVLETGVHANWVARLAMSHGHEVIVAQARRLRVIYENPTKSDEIDAQMLAELGSTHPELLHPVKVRSETTQAHLALLRAREDLVRARTHLVNAARGMAKSVGHRLPESSTEALPAKARDACPKILAPALRPLLATIAFLTREVRAIDRKIVRLVRDVYAQETRRLLEVPGVGPITSLTFVLIVGDPARFRSNRDVGAFVGLVPRRDQSGESDPQLPVTKCGDAMLRRLLVQCAHRTIGPFGEDTDLRRWGLARCERGGKSAKRRAIIAVARKLSVLLLALWKSGSAYEPTRNATAA